MPQSREREKVGKLEKLGSSEERERERERNEGKSFKDPTWLFLDYIFTYKCSNFTPRHTWGFVAVRRAWHDGMGSRDGVEGEGKDGMG